MSSCARLVDYFKLFHDSNYLVDKRQFKAMLDWKRNKKKTF